VDWRPVERDGEDHRRRCTSERTYHPHRPALRPEQRKRAPRPRCTTYEKNVRPKRALRLAHDHHVGVDVSITHFVEHILPRAFGLKERQCWRYWNLAKGRFGAFLLHPRRRATVTTIPKMEALGAIGTLFSCSSKEERLRPRFLPPRGSPCPV
jgi:hypothetical protein